MIQFPANFILYIYLSIMGVLVFISLGHIWHALRFGGLSPLAIFTSGVYIAGMAVILWGSSALLANVDWSGAWQIDLPAIDFFSS